MATRATEIWNDLPFETRKYLLGVTMQTQLRDYQLEKSRAKSAHQKHMREVNNHIKNIERTLREWEAEIVDIAECPHITTPTAREE